MNQTLLSTKQAAQQLGYEESHVRRLLMAGKLKGFKVGRAWLVKQAEVEQYLSHKS